MADHHTDSPPRQRIETVIRTFPFDNYGMDDVSFALEDDPEAQEWVPALARAVLATLGGEATD